MISLYYLIVPLLLLLLESVEASGHELLPDKQMSCEWSTQYLCGDKCVDKMCKCGENFLLPKYIATFVCCNKKPCLGFDGFAWCKDAQIQRWEEKCNGIQPVCKQLSSFGYTTLPCDDNKNCYARILSCGGKAQCSE